MAGEGKPGPAVGSKYTMKGRPWANAIERALAKRSLVARKDALDELAEKLLELADAGDLGALKELGDRMEGKARQQIVGAGANGEHMIVASELTDQQLMQIATGAQPDDVV